MQPIGTVHAQTARPTQKQPHVELRLQSLVAELQKWESSQSLGPGEASGQERGAQRKDRNDSLREHTVRGQSEGAGTPQGHGVRGQGYRDPSGTQNQEAEMECREPVGLEGGRSEPGCRDPRGRRIGGPRGSTKTPGVTGSGPELGGAWRGPLESAASSWPRALARPGAYDLHLVPLARDTTPGIRRRLTLDLGLHHHLTALQLHHTLIAVSWAVLRVEDTAVGAARTGGPHRPPA